MQSSTGGVQESSSSPSDQTRKPSPAPAELPYTTLSTINEYPGSGSVQYAFSPEGLLVIGPTLFDDPLTGKIYCVACGVLKPELNFLSVGPYRFKSPECTACIRVSSFS
jgi:hypothetical protein